MDMATLRKAQVLMERKEDPDLRLRDIKGAIAKIKGTESVTIHINGFMINNIKVKTEALIPILEAEAYRLESEIKSILDQIEAL